MTDCAKYNWGFKKMKKHYFNFDKFVKDQEVRETKSVARKSDLDKQNSDNRKRDLLRLYRDKVFDMVKWRR